MCEKLAPYHLDRPDRKSPTPADSTVLFGRNSMLPVLIHAHMKKIKIHLATSLGQVECKQSRRCFRCFLWQSKGTDVRISFSSVEKCPHLASNSFWLLSNGRLKQHNRSNRNFAKFIFQLDFFSPCYDCRIVICDHSCLPFHSNKYEGCATEHTHSDCKWLWIAWWWSWWSSSRHLRSMTVTHAAQLQSCFAQLNTCKFWFGLAGRAQNHVEQMHSSAEQVCACAARL